MADGLPSARLAVLCWIFHRISHQHRYIEGRPREVRGTVRPFTNGWGIVSSASGTPGTSAPPRGRRQRLVPEQHREEQEEEAEMVKAGAGK